MDKLNEKNFEEKKERKGRYVAPLPKDFLTPEGEEEVTPEGIQAAQKAIGEVLWLSTRTRPELAFGASKLSSQVTKRPMWVCYNSFLSCVTYNCIYKLFKICYNMFNIIYILAILFLF